MITPLLRRRLSLRGAALALAAAASAAACAAQTGNASSTYSRYLEEADAAMAHMMAAMSNEPTGDVDADFVEMMTAHHQGAIDMAIAELRHGRNEQLRRISQEIVVDQQQEIAAMRLAIGQQPPAAVPAPTRP